MTLFRKLDPSRERNRHDYSPYHLWMLRGIEGNIEISLIDLKRLLNSTPVVPIQKMSLPDPLKCLVFSGSSRHLYFTTPDLPNVIQAHFFPDPLKNPITAQKKFKSISEKYFKETSFPSITIASDDIIALSVTGGKLFALTVKRGRTKQNNLWQIYRYDINEDKGLVQTNSDEVTDLDFSSNPPVIDEKMSFVVISKSKFEQNFYLSGIKGAHVYWGTFKPGQKISPEVLISELSSPYFDTTSSLFLTKGHLEENSKLPQGDLLALDRVNSKIYRIVNEKGHYRVLDATPDLKKSPISSASTMTYISINTSDLTINIHPSGQTMFFYLIVSPIQKRVWTMSDLGVILPLIGGGRKTDLTFKTYDNPLMVDKEDDSNLLNLDIGDVDSICVVNNSFVIIGPRDKTGWKALLLPQMINMLSKNPVDYSREKSRDKKSSDGLYWS